MWDHILFLASTAEKMVTKSTSYMALPGLFSQGDFVESSTDHFLLGKGLGRGLGGLLLL
jgi:hypothetical protein